MIFLSEWFAHDNSALKSTHIKVDFMNIIREWSTMPLAVWHSVFPHLFPIYTGTFVIVSFLLKWFRRRIFSVNLSRVFGLGQFKLLTHSKYFLHQFSNRLQIPFYREMVGFHFSNGGRKCIRKILNQYQSGMAFSRKNEFRRILDKS